MVTYVKMPKLSWTMQEGVIVEWYKKEGDAVEKGETLCDIETEKAVDELKAPETGVLRKIVSLQGTVVPVNQIIAVIGERDEDIPDLKELIVSTEGVEELEKEPTVKPEEIPEIVDKPKVVVSPAARRLAKQYGIDLQTITGTGPQSRIQKSDILKVIEATEVPLAKISETIPITGMRKVIANRLSLSAKTALHVPITIEVDMTTSQGLLEELRDRFKDSVHISYTHILIKAVAKALEAHRMLNARVENEEIKVLEDINVGVAVALEGGLVVPVVRNANTKAITEVANILKDRVDKARQGTLSTREASGGTFTISNLGMFGIDLFAPIINPPETAILGVGRIVKKAVVKNEQITVSPTMTLTLVFDHRVLDGATAARFLQTLRQILEDIKEQDVVAR